MAGAGESPRTVVRIALKACNEVLDAEIRVPTAAIRPVDLLPILMSFDDAVVGIFEKDSIRQGKPITCTKGCGACCRQLVPISEVEAQYLAELVAEMPPDRRNRVETRFRRAREEFDRQGITKRLLRSAELASPEERRQLALDYFACGVAPLSGGGIVQYPSRSSAHLSRAQRHVASGAVRRPLATGHLRD